MELSLASIIAFFLLWAVAYILLRNRVLRRQMRELRGEMAEVQLKRLTLEVALAKTASKTASKIAAGTEPQPDPEPGAEGRR